MKKVLSVALMLAVMLTLAPAASAVTVPDKAPYSKPFLEGLSGVKFVSVEHLEDIYDEGSEGEVVVYTDFTVEHYDVSGLVKTETLDGVMESFCKRFVDSGYSRLNADNSIICSYREEDQSLQSFILYFEEGDNLLGVIHTYGYSLPKQKPGFENFRAYKRYENQFADVKDSDWFDSYVMVTYRLGLMSGDSPTAFNPSGNITVAETITIAARLNSIYSEGQPILGTDSDTWYAPYVVYAAANGIISAGEFGNYDEPITRADFAYILSAALPKEALEEICSVVSLPDMDESTERGKRVFTLYRAGVLTGSDAKGTFYPYSTIQRSEAAAILSRMALPDIRNTTPIGGTERSIKAKVNTVTGQLRPINAKWKDTYETVSGVKWTSSDTSIVTVDREGGITGVRPGRATITKTNANGSEELCSVTVLDTDDNDKKFVDATLETLYKMLNCPQTVDIQRVGISLYPSTWENIMFWDDNMHYMIKVDVEFSAEGLDGTRIPCQLAAYYDMDEYFRSTVTNQYPGAFVFHDFAIDDISQLDNLLNSDGQPKIINFTY